MRRNGFLMLTGALAALIAGCSKDEPSTTSAVKPREAPTLTPSTPSVNPPPLATMSSGESMTALPPGHPPINHGASSPPGESSGANVEGPEMTIQLQMPPEFKQQKLKPSPIQVTVRAYAAPKAEGDSEDAYVSISALGMKVPFQQNLDRWCGQFELPAGKTCETGLTQQKLDGSVLPTNVVEVAGTYKGSAMMGPWPGPMPGFAMIVAEIDAPDKPYYVKMIGPQKTVEQWKGKFIDAIKAAKQQ